MEMESDLGAPLLAEVAGVSHHGGWAMEHLLLSLALLPLLLASRVSASSAIRIRVILTRFLAEEEWRRRKEEEERRRQEEETGGGG